MAFSIDGIPAHLLPLSAKAEFITWIRDLPIDNMAKRRAITTWRIYNKEPFTLVGYRAAGLAP